MKDLRLSVSLLACLGLVMAPSWSRSHGEQTMNLLDTHGGYVLFLEEHDLNSNRDLYESISLSFTLGNRQRAERRIFEAGYDSVQYIDMSRNELEDLLQGVHPELLESMRARQEGTTGNALQVLVIDGGAMAISKAGVPSPAQGSASAVGGLVALVWFGGGGLAGALFGVERTGTISGTLLLIVLGAVGGPVTISIWLDNYFGLPKRRRERSSWSW